MARSLNNEANDDELMELAELLKNDILLQQHYDLLKYSWRRQTGADAINENEKENILRILQLAKQEDMPQIPASKRIIGKRYYAAAVILLLALAGLWWFKNSKPAMAINNNAEQVQTVAAPDTANSHVVLPDGSTVWVNRGSKIFYDSSFTGRQREITLEGEAYFDVVKNAERPFVVHVSGYDIKVLGTAFNVKSYPGDKTIEATLLRGLIQLYKKGDENKEPFLLHPNEKLVIDKTAVADVKTPAAENEIPAKEFRVVKIDSLLKESDRSETSWVYNRLVFRGDNFTKLAEKLERWYNISVVFEDEDVKQLSFNGSFENETAAQAFAFLKIAADFNYSIEGDKFFVSSVR